MNPKALKELIDGSLELALMRGGVKEATKEEQVTINFAFATVVCIKRIKKGEKFTKENIWVKRPGTGDILAEKYNSIIGKVAKRDILNDEQLSWKDVL